jgi:hypothetical protein
MTGESRANNPEPILEVFSPISVSSADRAALERLIHSGDARS